MPSRDDPESESLPELLDSLEETLSTLRSELEPDAGRPPTPFDRRRVPPRPPSMRDILRFTDEYTIPTVIAILEANVRLLKLAQAGIRAVDPERSVLTDRSDDSLGGELRRAASDAGRLSADRLASSLSELQRALEATDTPQNPEARELLTDARALSAEIEQRIRESREQTDLSRFDRRETWREQFAESDRSDGPVRIQVTDEADADSDRSAEEAEEPDVDVDAELESIKKQMGRAEGTETEADTGDDAPADTDPEGVGDDSEN
jgi:hypothetical protein